MRDSIILDHRGDPILSREAEIRLAHNEEVRSLRAKITNILKARYDAAQTVPGNANHWQNADYLDPHGAAVLWVRRILRIRSRYEIIENNPYLKGVLLTFANDFTGSGPRLAITEEGWDAADRKEVEHKYQQWWDACGLTRKLWRMCMAKKVDGEGFGFGVNCLRRPLLYRFDVPVELDYQLVEADRVSSPLVLPLALPTYQNGGKMMEADGVRWDLQENPIEYNLLPYHPGNMLFPPMGPLENWIKADNVIHWFRQDRGWLRGIPELTPSLPLASILRRYTNAVLRAAELQSNLTAVIESEAPPQALSSLGPDDDDPFDTFPPEPGMIMRMPWGYKMKAFENSQPMQVYDMFVKCILREALRPIGVPYNIGAGTSAESNMASAIVDAHIYRGTQQAERTDCEQLCLNKIFAMWWMEARLIPGYLPKVKSRGYFPTFCHRWDKVGLDHTDPEKVMKALEVAHTKGFLTDRDIQEQHFNRDVETWRTQLEEDKKFRDKLDLPIDTSVIKPEPPSSPGKTNGKPPTKKPPVKGRINGGSLDEEQAHAILKNLMGDDYELN